MHLETDFDNLTALKIFSPMLSFTIFRTREGCIKQVNISCHRFEPDMLAFSGCYFGGGEKERTKLGEIRKRWKTLHVRPQLFLRTHFASKQFMKYG